MHRISLDSITYVDNEDDSISFFDADGNEVFDLTMNECFDILYGRKMRALIKDMHEKGITWSIPKLNNQKGNK